MVSLDNLDIVSNLKGLKEFGDRYSLVVGYLLIVQRPWFSHQYHRKGNTLSIELWQTFGQVLKVNCD